MTYKTIMSIAKTVDEARFTTPIAADIARAFAATLVGVCPVPDYRRVFWDGDSTVMADETTSFAKVAAAIEAETVAEAIRTGVDLEWHAPRTKELNAVPCLVDHAHLADLVVTNAEDGYPPFLSDQQPHEALILGCGRPVLVLPSHGGAVIGGAALVAWNSDRASARALFDALPLLKLASNVDIIQFPDRRVPHGFIRRSIDDVAAMLARHGIDVGVHHPETPPDHVGETLFAWANQSEAAFVVMGGYGHSRIRQWVLGGVTRFALENRPLPILFGH